MRLIAFYLPQYHKIPENDQWWGEGFTEWRNVKKATPLFPGHYQPRAPLYNNYYDLARPDVIEGQMKLAGQHGVDGFCFYHYWFNGKLLLEKPVQLVLENRKCSLPFCFAWANESWSRTWHGPGGKNEILIPQRYGKEMEWKEHFDYFYQYFKDSRYIKIDNSPILLIYRVSDILDSYQMFRCWNNMAKARGFSGVYIISMLSWMDHLIPNPYINGTGDFMPGKSQRALQYKGKTLEPNKLDYQQAYNDCYDVKHSKNEFRCVFVDYDDTPRRGKDAIIYQGSTPELFQKNLEKTMLLSHAEGNEIVFINAWNEWGEGNYLEPDQRYGYSYLQAVKQAVDNFKRREF